MAMELADMGTPAIRPLIHALKNPDPMVRSTAVTINANGQVLGSTFTTQTSPSPVNGAPTGNFLSYAWLYSNGQISRIADHNDTHAKPIASFAAMPIIGAPNPANSRACGREIRATSSRWR